jgi:glutamate formiminotransferase
VAGGLIECVPNFSEGRDGAVVRAIGCAIANVPGARILRSEMDADHNRSVITFVAPPESVGEAAEAAIAKAAELIDLRGHAGAHPRIGAADVVPFVPLGGAGMRDCVRIARAVGAETWRRLGVPVYFYEEAALAPERKRLENVRRGGFEQPALTPDLGGLCLHPTAGACIIGARNLLVAFNVNLTTGDVAIARAIARKIRESSGGLPALKAMGVFLPSVGMAQVSMNLTNFERTPPHVAYQAVRAEAESRGVGIAGTQIVGLIPRKAVEMAEDYAPLRHFADGQVLEDLLGDA